MRNRGYTEFFTKIQKIYGIYYRISSITSLIQIHMNWVLHAILKEHFSHSFQKLYNCLIIVSKLSNCQIIGSTPKEYKVTPPPHLCKDLFFMNTLTELYYYTLYAFTNQHDAINDIFYSVIII